MTETTAGAAPVAPPKVHREGYYIVLLESEDGWVVLPAVAAKSASEAVRTWAKSATIVNGATVVAIPARSWRPVKVTAKTETKLIVEVAK